MSFSELGLAEPLLRAVAAQDYTIPTPIQIKAIPAVLSGRDLMAAAQTGTGKTAAFTLPLLQRLAAAPAARGGPRALILTPTRELAAQIEQSVVTYGQFLDLRAAVVFGGVNIRPQIDKLRRGVDILIATPGRLLDLHGQGAVSFKALEVLILDEADRMLDMGFIPAIRRILGLLPAKRQNLLFSATFSDDIRKLARGLLHTPLELAMTPERVAAETVEQHVYQVGKDDKPALLSDLIRRHDWHQVLVFTRTKHGADRLAKRLARDAIDAAAIHGNKSQNARTRTLDDFKNGRVQVLVATDIAARGLDIEELPQVVNFELPNVAEDYVHRIGRTGRAGAVGAAVSLVAADEIGQLKAIERLLRRSLPRIAIPDGALKELPHSQQVQPAPRDTARSPAKTQRDQRPARGPQQAKHTSAQAPGDQPRRRRRKRRSGNGPAAGPGRSPSPRAAAY